MQARISKWGNSQGVRIPKEVFDSVNFKIGDAVTIIVNGDSIILKKKTPKEKVSLRKLFEGYEGPGAPEFDWGEPVGREIW